ncbi:MOP flippase family protein [Aquimarina latercula]|uniref:MOP flippase family protein n=1 Tax=Aquimarina latercula TaxID=987 RepID=UPI000426D1B5|nr:MOP flippase family protein [Aquimarina latercula]
MSEIKKKVISGAKWSTLAMVIVTIINTTKIFVLTRYLSKEEFGVFAIILFVLGFTELFTDMGITTAILHKQNITKRQYGTLYWFNFGISIGSYLILLAITPMLSIFYEIPELYWLLPLAGVNLLFLIAGKQHKTIFQKELQFKLIGIVEITAALMSFIFMITLLQYRVGIEVIIFTALVQSILLSCAFLYKGLKSYPILRVFKLKEVKDMLTIGGFQLGSQVLNYFGRDFDIMILGKLVGVEILGGYSLAKQLIKKPQFILSSIIMRISNALFPRFQNEKEKLNTSFLYLIEFATLIFTFVFFYSFVMSEELMVLFYGAKYILDSPYLKWFSILILIRSILSLNYSLVVAKGKTNYDFYWNLANALVTIIVVYAIAKNVSVIWVIKGMCILSGLMLILGWFFFVKRMSSVSFFIYFQILFKNIAVGSIASGILIFLRERLVIEHLILELIVNLFIFVVFFGLFQWVVNGRMIKTLSKKLSSE